MGQTKLSDIPGNRFVTVYDISSVASNGGASRFAVLRAPQNIKILNAYWVPQSADQGANTASYRHLDVVNGGAAGTATTVIASLALSVSKASMLMAALSGTGTVAASSIVIFSQKTVGGDHTTGTVLAASRLQLEYQLL